MSFSAAFLALVRQDIDVIKGAQKRADRLDLSEFRNMYDATVRKTVETRLVDVYKKTMQHRERFNNSATDLNPQCFINAELKTEIQKALKTHYSEELYNTLQKIVADSIQEDVSYQTKCERSSYVIAAICQRIATTPHAELFILSTGLPPLDSDTNEDSGATPQAQDAEPLPTTDTADVERQEELRRLLAKLRAHLQTIETKELAALKRLPQEKSVTIPPQITELQALIKQIVLFEKDPGNFADIQTFVQARLNPLLQGPAERADFAAWIDALKQRRTPFWTTLVEALKRFITAIVTFFTGKKPEIPSVTPTEEPAPTTAEEIDSHAEKEPSPPQSTSYSRLFHVEAGRKISARIEALTKRQ